MIADGSRGRPPLRVAVLLDSLTVPAWVERVLLDVQSSPAASLVAVVRNAASRAPKPSFARRLWQQRSTILYELYMRLDRRLLPARPDPFARVDVSALLDGLPVIDVTPEQTRYSDYFPATALDRLRQLDLDVALRFGFRILRGAVLELPRFGVWSYHHDDSAVIRGGPPCFWEVMVGHPVTGSMLQVLSERLDAGRVLYRSWSPTHRRSVHRNRSHVYWKSAAFVRRELERLHRDGGSVATASDYAAYSERLFRKPANRQLLPLLARLVVTSVGARLIERLSHEQWFIAYRRPSAGPPADEFFRFKTVIPPPDRYWADPFPVHHAGRDYLFVEEYLYRRRRGHLSVLELGEQRTTPVATDVLARPYHLSHPFLFRHGNDLFMIPESAANRTVELYRCTEFPAGWTLESRLLEGVRAVDATLHHDGERWWMFVNLASAEATHCHDELALFHAASPAGPWQPHPRNPVVSDARRARPAGRLFEHGGRLYRPAQDCSVRYGYGLRIQRIRRLDLQAFEEEEEAAIWPRWRPGLLATHTLNRGDGVTVIDGMRRIGRWRHWLHRGR